MNLRVISRLLIWFAFLGLCEGFALPLIENGSVKGILVSKGEYWIEVKDDKGYVERYLAPWRGSGPTRGGGFDSSLLSRFKKLVVGNRVLIKWSWDGHLRVHEIELIRPSKSAGIFEGYLLEVGDRWIDVQNSDEGIPWRFYLPWVGGYPQNGGGYDQKVIEPLRKHEPTDPIIFEWNYQLRPRILQLVTREEISFKPFYELDEVPPWLGPPGENKNIFKPQPVNPFDLIEGKLPNPFDTVSPKDQGINPFENAGKQPAVGNPFDSAPSQGGNVNPFEQNTKLSPNPFDSAPPNENPFDQVSPDVKSVTPNPFDNATNPKDEGLNPFDQSPPSLNPFDSVKP